MYPSDIFFNSTLSLIRVIAISGIKITFKGFEEAMNNLFLQTNAFILKKKKRIKSNKQNPSIEELFLTAF